MSIEIAIKVIVEAALAKIPAPAVPYFWGIVPAGKTEYVSLSGVTTSLNPIDDFSSDNKQFKIVTKSGMVRAAAIRDVLKSDLERYKGVQSGMKIKSITHIRDVELPDATTGESIIASEYKFTYQGGI